jgi:hypothetical protein
MFKKIPSVIAYLVLLGVIIILRLMLLPYPGRSPPDGQPDG